MHRFLLLIVCIIPALVVAQDVEQSETDALLDDLFAADSLDILELFDSLKKQDYIYGNISFSDKTLFSGRNFGVDQHSFFPAISYISSSDFFANIGSGYYSEVSPQWDFITLSGGYSNYINKKKSLLATAVYSHTFFTQDVADLNNHRLSASLSYRKKWFRNSLSAGYLFGGTPSHYISNNLYVSIDILDSDNFDISIQPRFGMFWGNQTITELIGSGFQLNERITTVFQQLNTELSIPLEFDFGNWDMEFDYTFSIPNPIPGEEGLENIGVFSISLGYLISL